VRAPVAGVLAVFLVYVSIAGGRTPQLAPSQLQGHRGKVSLVGRVVDATEQRFRFQARG